MRRREELGRRGEELVFELERSRVKSSGLDETRVVWVSREDPGSPYDIRSVAEDGAVLWIEVKSTSGRDGRFEWSISEFELAVNAGEHYELWRVYEVDGLQPRAKRFRNPVSMFGSGSLHLDVASLRGEVEGLEARITR